MGVDYYHKDGTPATLQDFAGIFEPNSPDYRRVNLTQVGRFRVSTVFLGFDHSFGRGKPILFETMVFDRRGRSVYSTRYRTLKRAEQGHAQIVSDWLKMANDPRHPHCPECGMFAHRVKSVDGETLYLMCSLHGATPPPPIAVAEEMNEQ